jgi:hypothetical protein
MSGDADIYAEFDAASPAEMEPLQLRVGDIAVDPTFRAPGDSTASTVTTGGAAASNQLLYVDVAWRGRRFRTTAAAKAFDPLATAAGAGPVRSFAGESTVFTNAPPLLGSDAIVLSLRRCQVLGDADLHVVAFCILDAPLAPRVPYRVRAGPFTLVLEAQNFGESTADPSVVAEVPYVVGDAARRGDVASPTGGNKLKQKATSVTGDTSTTARTVRPRNPLDVAGDESSGLPAATRGVVAEAREAMTGSRDDTDGSAKADRRPAAAANAARPREVWGAGTGFINATAPAGGPATGEGTSVPSTGATATGSAPLVPTISEKPRSSDAAVVPPPTATLATFTVALGAPVTQAEAADVMARYGPAFTEALRRDIEAAIAADGAHLPAEGASDDAALLGAADAGAGDASGVTVTVRRPRCGPSSNQPGAPAVLTTTIEADVTIRERRGIAPPSVAMLLERLDVPEATVVDSEGRRRAGRAVPALTRRVGGAPVPRQQVARAAKVFERGLNDTAAEGTSGTSGAAPKRVFHFTTVGYAACTVADAWMDRCEAASDERGGTAALAAGLVQQGPRRPLEILLAAGPYEPLRWCGDLPDERCPPCPLVYRRASGTVAALRAANLLPPAAPPPRRPEGALGALLAFGDRVKDKVGTYIAHRDAERLLAEFPELRGTSTAAGAELGLVVVDVLDASALNGHGTPIEGKLFLTPTDIYFVGPLLKWHGSLCADVVHVRRVTSFGAEAMQLFTRAGTVLHLQEFDGFFARAGVALGVMNHTKFYTAWMLLLDLWHTSQSRE